VRLVRRAASDEIAELTVGFVTAALYRLPPAVQRAYRKRFPAVEVRLAHRTEKHGPAKAGLDTGFRTNPMREQKLERRFRFQF
jgi:hypothetical protein